MTTLNSRITTREPAVRDLAAIWIVVTAVLTYLDVPPQHAPLFAINLVLQASLGVAVITYLLKGVAPSLLLLCGPGLIFGGALSFAIFQVVGRGVIGLTVVTIISLAALILTLKHPDSYVEVARPLLLSVHALGLTALAMSSEFPWLLVVATASLLVALILDAQTSQSTPLRLLIVALYVALLAIATLFRGDYWWLITDDYKFFEVLTRHITRSGPLADWGSLDVSRYHWLSYGWAGLLDFSAGSPDVFVTLTRVMPFVYSAALAMSLLLITEQLTMKTGMAHRFLQTLPVWVLLASFRLDWAAPSTAGALAVVTSAVAVMLLVIRSPQMVTSRICLYLLLATVITLTKLPSALTLPAIILGTEAILATRSRLVVRRKLFVTTAVSIGGLGIIALLEPLSVVLGDFNVQWMRPDGAPLNEGLPFSLGLPLSQHMWIGVVIALMLILVHQFPSETQSRSPQLLLLSLTPLFVVGLLVNAVIPNTEKANVHEYFSTPNYFLAALLALTFSVYMPFGTSSIRWRRLDKYWLAIAVLIIGFQALISELPLPFPFNQTAVLNLLTDGRVLMGTGVIAALLVSVRGVRSQPAIPLLLLLTVSLVESGSAPLARLVQRGMHPELPAAELVSYMGSPDSADIGTWLRKNADANETIATNSLFLEPRGGVFGDDYSLAMWSQREFLVLGPKFFGAAESASDEIELSIRFGSEPTAADASTLRQRGVRWFVVDTAETDRSTWEPFATVAFRNQRFVVLKLLDEF